MEIVPLILENIGIYWRTLFLILYPIGLSSMLVYENTSGVRCFLVILLMCGFYFTKVLPLAITAFLPIALLPLFGSVPSYIFAEYFDDTNWLTMGTIMLAIAMEESNVNLNIAIFLVRWNACNPRKIHFFLMLMAMGISMWIPNTTTSIFMCPIVESTLTVLESQDIACMYKEEQLAEDQELQEPVTEVNADEELYELSRIYGEKFKRTINDDIKFTKRERDKMPSDTSMCFYLGTAFASSIGDTGFILGSHSNALTDEWIHEGSPYEPKVTFVQWAMIFIPVMMTFTLFTYIWLEFLYMGLFRSNSKEAKRLYLGRNSKVKITDCLNSKLHPKQITCQQVCIFSFVIMMLGCYLFRRELFIKEENDLFGKNISNTTLTIITVLLLLIVPKTQQDLTNLLNREPECLVSWKAVLSRIPWELLFFLGSSKIIYLVGREMGMYSFLYRFVHATEAVPYDLLLYFSMAVAIVLTQFLSKTMAQYMVMHVFILLAQRMKEEPILLILSVTAAISYSFCFEMSTGAMAVVCTYCRIPAKDIFKAGAGTAFLGLVVLIVVFPLVAKLVLGM